MLSYYLRRHYFIGISLCIINMFHGQAVELLQNVNKRVMYEQQSLYLCKCVLKDFVLRMLTDNTDL